MQTLVGAQEGKLIWNTKDGMLLKPSAQTLKIYLYFSMEYTETTMKYISIWNILYI